MRKITCPSCAHVTSIDDAYCESSMTCGECGAELPLAPAPTRVSPRPSRSDGNTTSIWSVLGAPGSGAVRALWVGLLLVVISFGVKQVIISWSMWNLGTALEEPRLQAKRSAEIARLDDGSRARREAIHERYREQFEDLRGDSASASASALMKLQWFCYLKVVLDIVRLLGAILVLFAALHIVLDKSLGTWMKAYGVVCGGVALLTVVFGGLLTLVA
jgi:hypothetical protein